MKRPLNNNFKWSGSNVNPNKWNWKQQNNKTHV